MCLPFYEVLFHEQGLRDSPSLPHGYIECSLTLSILAFIVHFSCVVYDNLARIVRPHLGRHAMLCI